MTYETETFGGPTFVWGEIIVLNLIAKSVKKKVLFQDRLSQNWERRMTQ